MNRPVRRLHLLGKDGVISDGSSKRYPLELRERAVRMVAEISDQDKSEWTAITEVAGLRGVGTGETCAAGCARPRSMPVHGQERRPKSPQSSSACGERTPNYAGLTRF